jgi:hypothetical protein
MKKKEDKKIVPKQTPEPDSKDPLEFFVTMSVIGNNNQFKIRQSLL